MSEFTDDQVLDHYDQQRRFVIDALLNVETDGPPGPPDPAEWQLVVAGLAEVLGVEAAAFAVEWFEMLDGHPDPEDYLRRAQLPEDFEAAVLAEIEARRAAKG
jgi:hypothetical protein